MLYKEETGPVEFRIFTEVKRERIHTSVVESSVPTPYGHLSCSVGVRTSRGRSV